MELGIGEHDAIERIEQAIDYWQERCPERTASALCLDHVSSVLTFLAEADIPVRFCLLAKKRECRQYTLYRSLSTIVQRCPALLMASINDDLIPMFALFDELQIRGMNQWRCGVADGWVVVVSGTPRTSICVSEPRLLLEGQKDAIRHIVMSLRRLGIHESRVHRLIGACPLILMESIESFNEALIRLSCLFASEEDLILSIDSCPHLILNSELRFNVRNGHCHIMMKKCRVYTGSTPSVEDNSDDARRGASVRAKRAQTAHQGSEEVRTYLRVVYRIRVDDSRNQVDTPILPSASHTQVEVHVIRCRHRFHSIHLCDDRLSMLKEKTKFLTLVAKRPIHDILSYPYYFHYSIDRTIGPRFTFLKERANAALHEASLESLVRPSDSDFARKIAKVIEEEYVVYQTQWTHMYGHKFDFLGRPRQQNTIS